MVDGKRKLIDLYVRFKTKVLALDKWNMGIGNLLELIGGCMMAMAAIYPYPRNPDDMLKSAGC